jgi:AraC-like DNA-binding protein
VFKRAQSLTALRRARDLIDRDFAEPLTLDSMAQAAHLSKFHFAVAAAIRSNAEASSLH